MHRVVTMNDQVPLFPPDSPERPESNNPLMMKYSVGFKSSAFAAAVVELATALVRGYVHFRLDPARLNTK